MSLKKNFDTPVLFIVFNRPKLTKIVFEKLRQIKPKKLFISADGPRINFPEDKEMCNEVKNIIKRVDWECEFLYQIQDKNLGCRLNMINSITWFFNQVDKGIILEDDCLPNDSFFEFCELMLNKFEAYENVFQVNGINWLEIYPGEYDYFFTRYPAIWGWATWKERWEKYKVNLSVENMESIKNIMHKLFNSDYEINHHFKSFEKSLQIDTWDYNWKFTIFENYGLCITPKKNLVKNIGFSSEATHTTNPGSWQSKLKVFQHKIDINHEVPIEINSHYDKVVGIKFGFRKRSLIIRFLLKLRRIVSRN